MKQPILRFACVFIILIFCLAPLSAIDFNQDNNTKYISTEDNKGIAVDDLNITAGNDGNKTNDVDAAVDIDNETEDMDTLNTAESEMAVDLSEVYNETDNSESEVEPISINVDDIWEGETAFIEIHTAENFIGAIYLICNRKNTILWPEDGYASLSVDGLEPGTYTVEAYVHDSYQRDKTTFTVKEKINPILSVKAEDIEYGRKASAHVQIDNDYTGNVDIVLDGVEHHSLDVKDGSAHIVFDKDLKPGQHTVKVTSEDVSIYKKSERAATFTVSKKYFLDVQVDDVTEGDPAVVKINTAKDFDGFILCFFDHNYFEPILMNNGSGVCIYNQNLNPGTHEVMVRLISKDSFSENEKIVKYNVNKKDSA